MGTAPLTPESLLAVRTWFRAEARPFPWTLTQDPYAIWISEVMLQQTVVTAVVTPFLEWMAKWPDLASLAGAEDDAVLRAWEGLGYASRARNLLRAARQLANQGRATLPDSEQELRELPGIGEYTAAAVLSFAFHRPALTLDANLKRVFQRLDGAPLWTPSLEARWRSLWSALVDGPSSRESNQALMQLGQQICRPKKPACERCPLAGSCCAKREGTTDRIPEIPGKTVHEKATTVVFWFSAETEHWWLARPESGRFSNLWLAPAWVDSDAALGELRPLTSRVHSYTKYRDRLSPLVGRWLGVDDPVLAPGWVGRWVSLAEARSLGMASVYRKILEEAIQLTIL